MHVYSLNYFFRHNSYLISFFMIYNTIQSQVNSLTTKIDKTQLWLYR